jgi:hypothetical protein
MDHNSKNGTSPRVARFHILSKISINLKKSTKHINPAANNRMVMTVMALIFRLSSNNMPVWVKYQRRQIKYKRDERSDQFKIF